jgi:hypothetical protein
MITRTMVAAAAFATLLSAAPLKAATPAQDVADIASTACFGLAAGKWTLPHPAKSEEFDAAVTAQGLQPNITAGMLKMLGPATALILRTGMARRTNGESHIVFAANGMVPGCRVILLGEPSGDAMAAVSAALTRAGPNRWTAFPDMDETRGIAEKRVFLRRDAKGAAYLLNLVRLTQPVGKIQLYATVVAVPAGVDLPKGF